MSTSGNATLLVAALTLAATPLSARSEGQPPPAPAPAMAFATLVGDSEQERAAALLIEGIRAFGGDYRDSPVYVLLADPDNVPASRLQRAGVRLVPLRLGATALGDPFAVKAYAAATAESLAAGRVRTLAWFDAETFLFQPPQEMALAPGRSVALKPVHLTNAVGLPEGAPLDGYWSAISRACGADTGRFFAIESQVDARRLRAYFNCGIFSVRPELGILRDWAQVLDGLLRDEGFQRRWCADRPHRIFLHQVVLSALLVTRLQPQEFHFLPAAYGYPLHLHDRMPAGKRARALNDLVTAHHEAIWKGNPDWMQVVPAEGTLKTWLTEAYLRSLMVTEHIYREEGSCNSYLVTTAKGSVLIDPGGASAPHSWLRRAARTCPVQAILLTHAHDDHRAGIASWRGEPGIPVVGQRESREFLAYQDRLGGFFARRNAVQNGTPAPPWDPAKATPLEATVLFGDHYTYALGELRFELFHTGGETPDQAVIWVPQLKAVFIGDNYYTSFPNLYTLRGTRPRWALDYLAALERAVSLEPEVLLPGHDAPLVGRDLVRRRLTEYRDALRYVHDETVKGMNEGKDVFTLMREIRLPEAYGRVGQFFGRVSWSVRGIYEGYAGWFDEDPASMYDQPTSSIAPEVLRLCGGSDVVARRAMELANGGDEVSALHLAGMVLRVETTHRAALEARLAALRSLRAKSRNYIERQWLDAGIRAEEERLEGP